MITTTKLLQNANDTVIPISKSDKIIWDTMFDSLEDISDDFMPTRTEPQQDRLSNEKDIIIEYK